MEFLYIFMSVIGWMMIGFFLSLMLSLLIDKDKTTITVPFVELFVGSLIGPFVVVSLFIFLAVTLIEMIGNKFPKIEKIFSKEIIIELKGK